MQEEKQNISPIKQRILSFAETLGISKREFYTQIGVSRGTLESKSSITEDGMARFIARFPQVSPSWLLTGNGDMIISQNTDLNIIYYKQIMTGCYVNTFLSPLSLERETECLKKVAQNDKEAKDELILHNMRLVAHVTKKYAVSEDEMEELISIGTIGLIKAVSSFKADYGNRFATFAIRCIENEILMHFRSRKKSRGDVSIFEPIGTDKEGNQIHLVDVIENGQSDVVSDIEVSESLKILRQNMRSVLSDREYYIITKRFGLDGEKELTQRQIAKTLSISRSYVSRIEKAGLKKLRKLLE